MHPISDLHSDIWQEAMPMPRSWRPMHLLRMLEPPLHEQGQYRHRHSTYPQDRLQEEPARGEILPARHVKVRDRTTGTSADESEGRP
jgi:hypothetical protein